LRATQRPGKLEKNNKKNLGNPGEEKYQAAAKPTSRNKMEGMIRKLMTEELKQLKTNSPTGQTRLRRPCVAFFIN
jgi:hypothetical protein